MIRRLLRREIPSMFHRRLLLLLIAAGMVGVVLAVQTANLTLGANHRRSLEKVEDALTETTLIPTVRGAIRDRKGRVLALDKPGFDVAVDYRVISGEWAYQRAFRDARADNSHRWAELGRRERERLIARAQAPYDRQVDQLWRTLADLGEVDRTEIAQRKSDIIARVQKVASHLWAAWREQREAELGEPVRLPEVAKPIGEQRQAHAILRDVPEQVHQHVLHLQSQAAEGNAPAVWQEVEIDYPKQRRYPRDTRPVELDRSHLPGPLANDEPISITVRGVGMHVVGLMRDVWEEDVSGENARPFNIRSDLGGYLPGDRVGRFGVEARMESRLRGRRGKETRRLDTGETRRDEPVRGKDVRLTIDIHLQARVQAVMSPEFGLMRRQPWHGLDSPEREGEPLHGAAVVLDAETSEVLAAVSMPSMPLKLVKNNPDQIYKDRINKPYLNRTVSRPYQPGSTIKPIMFTAAVSAGVHALGKPIDCLGYLNPDDPLHYRCWIFKRHTMTHNDRNDGPLTGADAIARSCNVYFYKLGRDMGVPRIGEWYGKFGLGAPTDVGLPEEVGGDLPTPEAGETDRFLTADAIFMGIGQGPVRWTPMQAAGAYATLVRGGLAMGPTIIDDRDRAKPRQPHQLPLNQTAIDVALEGVKDVVNTSYGTGRTVRINEDLREPLFDIEGVTVWGKSGTAQGVPQRIDSNEDGRITRDDEIVQTGDHAWFIALPIPEGETKPTHVVVVVSEYAGSGSQVSGPVASEIVRALKAEGYL